MFQPRQPLSVTEMLIYPWIYVTPEMVSCNGDVYMIYNTHVCGAQDC